MKWDAPPAHNNSRILYYVVEYREEGGSWVAVPDNVTETMVTIDTGLTNGTMYEVHVQAVNGMGRSGWSEVGSGIPSLSEGVADTPEAPTVNPTANTRGSLDVTWDAPADNGSAIYDYTLRYKPTSGEDWTLVSAPVTETSATISMLPNGDRLADGTTYEVQVQAWNVNGSSGWSPSGEGTTETVASTENHGRITGFSIEGATEKAIDGVKRMHLTEGGITTATVEVTWTNQQLTALWQGRTTANPPAPAVVFAYEVAVVNAASQRWLSPIETSEVPGDSYRGGKRLGLATARVRGRHPQETDE